jgi:hypothetical protein
VYGGEAEAGGAGMGLVGVGERRWNFETDPPETMNVRFETFIVNDGRGVGV